MILLSAYTAVYRGGRKIQITFAKDFDSRQRYTCSIDITENTSPRLVAEYFDQLADGVRRHLCSDEYEMSDCIVNDLSDLRPVNEIDGVDWM